MRERTRPDTAISSYRKIAAELDDALGLIELAEAEGDQEMVAEAEKQLETLTAEVHKRELESLLSGEADGNDCYLEIHAGAGGTEAQDWAEMLLRVYVCWAGDRASKVEVLRVS